MSFQQWGSSFSHQSIKVCLVWYSNIHTLDSPQDLLCGGPGVTPALDTVASTDHFAFFLLQAQASKMNTLLTLAIIATTVAATPASIESSNSTSASRMLARGCFIAHNIDHVYNDLSNTPASSSDQCCSKCWATNGCKSWTWTNYNGGTCWFKSRSPDGWVVNVGADSCVMNSGLISGPGFRNCDMPGNELYSEPGPDPDVCSSKCASNSACKAVTWAKNVCYYKSDVRTCVLKQDALTYVPYNRFVVG